MYAKTTRYQETHYQSATGVYADEATYLADVWETFGPIDVVDSGELHEALESVMVAAMAASGTRLIVERDNWSDNKMYVRPGWTQSFRHSQGGGDAVDEANARYFTNNYHDHVMEGTGGFYIDLTYMDAEEMRALAVDLSRLAETCILSEGDYADVCLDLEHELFTDTIDEIVNPLELEHDEHDAMIARANDLLHDLIDSGEFGMEVQFDYAKWIDDPTDRLRSALNV